jgi:hypothetical protein
LPYKAENIKMDKLKYPAEFLMCGFRSADNKKDFDNWCLMGQKRVRSISQKLTAPALIWNTLHNECQLVCREAKEVSCLDPIVKDVGVIAHGTDIFKMTRLPFYNSYLPARYAASTSLVSPNDSSAFLIPFDLFPGDKDPSGYYNLSTGRELFIGYKSDTIAMDNLGELVVSMSAINFLMRRGDVLSLMVSL